MKKTILVSREGGETRACLLVSGKLVNVDAEGHGGSSISGNIYKGRITAINRSLNAAFVDIGEEREGFLSVQDVHPALLEGYDHRPAMHEIFDSKQEILVQVGRDPVKEKGAMLTTCVSLPGRYAVLIPASERSGISKKLPDDERKRLRDIIHDVKVPEGFGVIIRTAGEGKTKQELLRDINRLKKTWNQIEKAFKKAGAPSLLVQDQGVAVRFLREYLTADVVEIQVDDKEAYQEVGKFLDMVMPRQKKLLKAYKDPMPMFVRFGVENQIEKMFLRTVPLPSGGSIVIDRTEALTAIDVNSGKTRSKNIEATATQANVEAAEEIASQMVLRDLGGLVVIDFIDMDDPKNRRKVQQRLRESLKADKAKCNFGRISQFGLLEMTRQRLRSGVVSRESRPCDQCGGVGYVRIPSSSALHILRRIRELAVSGSCNTITVSARVEVANFMQNSLRDLIYSIESDHNIRVTIISDPGAVTETIEHGQVVEDEKKSAPVETPAYINAIAEPKEERKEPPEKRKQDKDKAPDKGGRSRADGARKEGTRDNQRRRSPRTGRSSQRQGQQRRPQKEDRTPDEQPQAKRTEDRQPPPLPRDTDNAYPKPGSSAWDMAQAAQKGGDGLLDSFIKKLLGISR